MWTEAKPKGSHMTTNLNSLKEAYEELKAEAQKVELEAIYARAEADELKGKVRNARRAYSRALWSSEERTKDTPKTITPAEASARAIETYEVKEAEIELKETAHELTARAERLAHDTSQLAADISKFTYNLGDLDND